jgi:hypothetical protein
VPVSDRHYEEEISMTEAATYPCAWSISYTDFDGSLAGAGCDDVATVLLYDPQTDDYGPPRPFGFCSFHATTEPIDAERVQIAELVATCTSCHRPVWLAHAEEHEIGRVHPEGGICQDRTPDHAPCACPHEAAYEAAMLVAHEADR